MRQVNCYRVCKTLKWTKLLGRHSWFTARGKMVLMKNKHYVGAWHTSPSYAFAKGAWQPPFDSKVSLARIKIFLSSIFVPLLCRPACLPISESELFSCFFFFDVFFYIIFLPGKWILSLAYAQDRPAPSIVNRNIWGCSKY